MKPTLTIAIPSRGVVDPAFAMALRMIQISPEQFDGYRCLYLAGADAAVARNVLLDRIDTDYVFFLDDDVIPEPDVIQKLFADKKDFVCGVYYAKQQPHYPQIHRKNPIDPNRYDAIFDVPDKGLIEVDACGAGCMLFKRSILEKVKKPYFHFIPAGETELRKGEDFYFCEKLKAAGVTLYADVGVRCKHLVTKAVTSEFWEISKQQIAKMKEEMGEEKFEQFKRSQWE